METCDDEFVAAASDFIKRADKKGTPFFVWLNTTHMHFITHTKKKSLGQAGEDQSAYHDTMVDHDRNVGQMLELLDDLGLADDTIVIYSTDNGPHMNSWPDAGMTPFRSEKNTNWEGAFRIPEMIRWPGHIPAGTVSNEIIQHHDWLPTLLAAAGDTTCMDRLKKGTTVNGRKYKNHIDGFNFLPHLTGETKEGPRNWFFYFSDDGDVLGIRWNNWKIVFMEQRCKGTMQVWAEPFTTLRCPKIFNLRTDPYERADVTSNTYWDWMIHHAFFVYGASAAAAQFMGTFKEFPPAQLPGTFTVDQAMQKMSRSAARVFVRHVRLACCLLLAAPFARARPGRGRIGEEAVQSRRRPDQRAVPVQPRRRLRRRRQPHVRQHPARRADFDCPITGT